MNFVWVPRIMDPDNVRFHDDDRCILELSTMIDFSIGSFNAMMESTIEISNIYDCWSKNLVKENLRVKLMRHWKAHITKH